MSYDVGIAGRSFNYTCNLGPLFHTHLDGGIKSLDGLRGASASRSIDAFLASMNAERQIIGQKGMKAKYDDKNGWGSFVDAVGFVLNIKTACEENPRHKVSVYY